jgi:hypothetical protein
MKTSKVAVGLILLLFILLDLSTLMMSPASTRMDPTTELTALQWKYFNQLKKLHKQVISSESNIRNLKAHLNNNITPIGLAIKIKPQTQSQGLGPGFDSTSILHNADKSCMQIIIKKQKKAINTTKTKITHIDYIMKQHLSTAHIQGISAKLETTNTKLTNMYNIKHIHKLNKRIERKRNEQTTSTPNRINNRRYRKKNCRKKKQHCAPPASSTTVVNLSSKPLTSFETSVLEKGLSFCPTPTYVNVNEIKSDIQNFKRRCRLAYQFRNHDNNDRQPSPGPFPKEKSTYNPPANENENLETFLNMIEGDILNKQNWNKMRSNLPSNERSALDNLKSRKDIVIKAADKGGSTVVMDTQWYQQECEKQLTNTNFYERLEEDPTELYAMQLQKKINRWKNKKWITTKIAAKLLPPEPKPGHFYGLPKIHKEGTPLRPIIPQCRALTTPLARYVDHVLQPIVQQLPSYIKDTNHHLEDLSDVNIPDNALLVTLDVKSLYTNIPHQFGIDSVHNSLVANNINNPELIIEMLKFLLEHNFFTFNNIFYLQTHGTAMGSKVAPSYANIAMNNIESKILLDSSLKPTHWKRYIDDIRFIWTHGYAELQQFHTFCNEIHPTLKFTIEHSAHQLPFLDTMMTISDSKITTTIYSKPTDKHSYLWHSSCHPKHTFNSITWSQTLRHRRICATDHLYDEATRRMKEHFTNRGYNPDFIQRNINKAKQMNRNDLISKTSTTQKKPVGRIPLTITYNPALPNLSRIIHRHWGLIIQDTEAKKAIQETPFIAYKQPRNIKKSLVRATITEDSNRNTCAPGYNKPCGECNQCKYIKATTTITSTTTGSTHNIVGQITCNTRNLIYLVTCQKCSKQYVGETKRHLKKRIYEHIYSIRNNKPTPIAQHFNTPGHDISHFEASGLCKMYGTSTNSRRQCELKYITSINTLSPNGINRKDW